MGIALVVNSRKKLLGTVTDGDIRRALIRHVEMSVEISEAMEVNPIVASVSDSRETIEALMRRSKLLQLPILDSNRRVVGLECHQEGLYGTARDNFVLIMAGGPGKRLRPLTNDVPKPLLPVMGKPILERILEQLISSGISKFFISTCYMAEKIQSYFGNGDNWGVDIQYLQESEPLGTAGSLALLPSSGCNLPINRNERGIC